MAHRLWLIVQNGSNAITIELDPRRIESFIDIYDTPILYNSISVYLYDIDYIKLNSTKYAAESSQINSVHEFQ